MRAAAAAAAFILCLAAGLRHSAALKRRAELLGELVVMLKLFGIEIRCCAYPLDELCERAEGRFAELVRAAREHCPDIRSAWERACSQMRGSGYGAAETELMRELGKSLGTSDIAGQETLLALHGERLSALYEQAAADYAKKGKTFRSVGLLCGAGAAVLLI